MSYEEADFLPSIFGKFRDEVVKGTIPVVLFGAGSAGKELCSLLRLHGVNPVCFCDNNPARAGELYCELPIISLEELGKQHKSSMVVIALGRYIDNVKQQLIDLGHMEDNIRMIENYEAMCYYTHLTKWGERDLLLREDEILNVYKLLSDSKSKDIFISLCSFFVGGADYRSFLSFICTLSDVVHHNQTTFQEHRDAHMYGGHYTYDVESYLYFNNDLIVLQDDEFFIDGGAYNGDSVREFINACNRRNITYRKIICFEPNTEIFAELQTNTMQYTNVVLVPFGLWSHSADVTFDILSLGSSQIRSRDDNTPFDTSHINHVQSISIDSYVSNESVSLIKLDIEGAEVQALRGATKTIRRCRPKLIISAYHNIDDILEIPLVIHSIVPDYRLYFRHFSTNFTETVLFAIP
ncbi:MAG TPA: FkbM family methyltransferase [Syntrophobacteraceae bacterium]|nr:FkbM family methyltransferase [Syntrophobacteraceae bacterium]